MLLTTGHEFFGYQITEYMDVIFDEMLIPSGLCQSAGSVYDSQLLSSMGIDSLKATNQLHNAKQALKDRMIEQATQLGANGLIGVCFSVSSIHDCILVSMSATVVKVEKASYRPSCKTVQKDVAKPPIEQQVDSAEQIPQETDLPQHTQSFDVQSLLDTVSKFQSTKEIAEYIAQQSVLRPELFDATLLSNLEKCKNLERIYGSATGIESAIAYITDAMKNVNAVSENIPDFLSNVCGE